MIYFHLAALSFAALLFFAYGSYPYGQIPSKDDISIFVNNKLILDFSKKLQDPWLRDTLKVPTLLLIAPQSNGKSLLISILSGLPVTHSSNGKTTTRPILYIFRDSETTGAKYCRVEGREINIEKVYEAVQQANLDTNGKLIDDQIVVEISQPKLINLDILDLPGYPAKTLDQVDYEAVKSILKRFAVKENSIIVTIGDGSNPDPGNVGHSFETVDEILNDIRPNWRNEVIYIKNKVNTALESMSTAKEVDKYFLSTRPHGQEFFAVLKPDKEIEFDKLPFDKAREMIENIREEGEIKFLFDQISRIEKKDPNQDKVSVDVKNIKTFGVKSISFHLQEMAMKMLIKQFPLIKEKINKEIKHIESSINEISREIDSLNPNKAKDMYWSFIREYVRNLKALIAFEVVYDKTIPSRKLFEPANFTLTFQQEYSLAHEGQDYLGGIIPTYDDLVKMVNELESLGQTDLHYQVKEAKLYGHSSKERFINVIKLVISKFPMVPLNDEYLFNCVNSDNHGVSGINSKKGLHCILESSVRSLEVNVGWIVNHVEMLLKQHNTDAINTILNGQNPEYKAFGTRHQHFIKKFMNSFDGLVANQSNTIRSAITNLISDYAVTIDLNEPFYIFSLIANFNYPPGLFIQGREDNGFFDYFLSLLSDGSKAAQGGEFLDAINTIVKLKSKLPIFSPVQLGPMIDGNSLSFNSKQIRSIAELHFYFIKYNIAFRMTTIIQAQYQYFVNNYLDYFNQDITKLISGLTNEDIQADLMNGNYDTKDLLEQQKSDSMSKLIKFQELREDIKEIERQKFHKHFFNQVNNSLPLTVKNATPLIDETLLETPSIDPTTLT